MRKNLNNINTGLYLNAMALCVNRMALRVNLINVICAPRPPGESLL